MQIYMSGVGTILSEFPVLQNSADIEIRTGIPAPQSAPAEREIMRRKLEIAGQGIPMHLLLGST